MRYWRSLLTTGGWRYARTYDEGYRCDRLNAAGDEWIRDDLLWSEIHNTGNWDPAKPAETEAFEAARLALSA